LPSEIYVARALGIYNTMWGIWIMKFHFLGLYFLVMCESFRAIPKDFAEAAYIDGAGYFYTFIKIMLPIVSNMLITIFIIYFVQFWNDYQTPLIYIRTQPTLSYGLFMLKYMDGELNFLPGQMAGCLVVLFPVLLLFIIFHNRFLNNVSMGGLKE
jgi:multiple sugar transport system permease protein